MLRWLVIERHHYDLQVGPSSSEMRFVTVELAQKFGGHGVVLCLKRVNFRWDDKVGKMECCTLLVEFAPGGVWFRNLHGASFRGSFCHQYVAQLTLAPPLLVSHSRQLWRADSNNISENKREWSPKGERDLPQHRTYKRKPLPNAHQARSSSIESKGESLRHTVVGFLWMKRTRNRTSARWHNQNAMLGDYLSLYPKYRNE